MNANMMERRRKVTEELISQIEGCLTDQLLREQFSDLYHPIPALVPQISGHSSFRTVCSSTSESSKKATSVSPNSALENIPPMNKNSPQTSIKDAETNHLNKGGGPDEASLSNTGELSSSVPKASELEPGVNWRLLQQIRSRNTSKFLQSSEKRGLPSASHASPLNEAQYLDKSSAVTAFTAKSVLTRPSIGENRDLRAEDTRSRARSVTKKEANEKGERRPSQQRLNLHDSQLIAKIRTQKPSDCLSERQLNGYRSLQRRLEYDPRASVAKERLKSKIWENRNNNADGSYATLASNRDGEVGEAAKAKATGRQSSIDSKVQSPPGQRKLIGVTQRTDSPAPKNHRIMGTSGDAPNRSATNSPFDRTRSERQRKKSKRASADVETPSSYSDAAVEVISQKLDRLAKHVIHLRRLVERDYSEVGYCSAGDDIYADEEVGAVSNGRPTGMLPSIASSLRSIRLLEANVQEIFDLLYLDEARIWSPLGLENE